MKDRNRKGIIVTIIFLITVTIAVVIFAANLHDDTPEEYSPAHPNNITPEITDIEKTATVDVDTSSISDESTTQATVDVDTSSISDEPTIQVTEEERLLAITQTTAGYQMETYIYIDMNHDDSKELIGVCRDNTDSYQTWYCSSDGETCFLVHQNNEGMDACVIELLEFDNETHVIINAYRMLGTGKNYTIIAFKDNAISCLLSNRYGYVRMTENGDITLDVEAYDAMYDPDFGTSGHTWNDTYLYFDGETYREYGATKITETEYLCYENSQILKDMIANELKRPDAAKLEYSYFIRKNNLLHIQCDVYSNSGAIQYGYYTVRFSDHILDEQLGEYTAGQMAPHYSDLNVTY